VTEALVYLAALGLTLICGAGLSPLRKVRWAVGIPGVLMLAVFIGLAIYKAAG
jgi:hypothetical protein